MLGVATWDLEVAVDNDVLRVDRRIDFSFTLSGAQPRRHALRATRDDRRR